MITAKFGTWVNPTTFYEEGKSQMRITVYSYQELIKSIKNLFPFDCFIQLEGNVIKNYVEVE